MQNKIIVVRTREYSIVGCCQSEVPEQELDRAGFKPRMTVERVGTPSKAIPDWFEHPITGLQANVYSPHNDLASVLKIVDVAQEMRKAQR